MLEEKEYSCYVEYVTFFRYIFLLSISALFADSGFQMIVLGSGGGPLESNMSGYMIAPMGSENYVMVDAGTLLHGLYAAQKHLKKDPVTTLQEQIKAYLLTHAHIDHVAALVINSTMDTKKPIFGLSSTIDNVRDNLFNWKIWPNFGSEGERPLNQYKYIRLDVNVKTDIPNTDMQVWAFPLSHPDGYLSTAYLLQSNEDYYLHFGDTSPDEFEQKHRIQTVWEHIAPLVRKGKLRHISLECSYPNNQPNKDTYGHLKSKYWIEEFQRLAELVNPNDPTNALNGLHAYVIHVKQPPFVLDVIKKELNQANHLGLMIHFPQQGESIILR